MTDLDVNRNSIPGARGSADFPALRLHTVEGLHNLRDLGGYKVTGGGRIRWGVLFRAGILGALAPDTEAQIAALGVRTVVDLREEDELVAPQLDEAESLVAHRNPLYYQRIEVEMAHSLEAFYRLILDVCATEIAAAVELLAAPDALPGLVHCSAGKDRTGLVIGLLLSALGVADETVAEDYARTEDLFSPQDRERMLVKAESLGMERERAEVLISSPAGVMRTSLAGIRETHGDARSYLLAHGVAPESLDALRAALVDPDA